MTMVSEVLLYINKVLNRWIFWRQKFHFYCIYIKWRHPSKNSSDPENFINIFKRFLHYHMFNYVPKCFHQQIGRNLKKVTYDYCKQYNLSRRTSNYTYLLSIISVLYYLLFLLGIRNRRLPVSDFTLKLYTFSTFFKPDKNVLFHAMNVQPELHIPCIQFKGDLWFFSFELNSVIS